MNLFNIQNTRSWLLKHRTTTTTTTTIVQRLRCKDCVERLRFKVGCGLDLRECEYVIREKLNYSRDRAIGKLITTDDKIRLLLRQNYVLLFRTYKNNDNV